MLIDDEILASLTRTTDPKCGKSSAPDSLHPAYLACAYEDRFGVLDWFEVDSKEDLLRSVQSSSFEIPVHLRIQGSLLW